MTQPQMEQRIKQWTGDKTADYGALCNDVAQLRLQKVNALPGRWEQNMSQRLA